MRFMRDMDARPPSLGSLMLWVEWFPPYGPTAGGSRRFPSRFRPPPRLSWRLTAVVARACAPGPSRGSRVTLFRRSKTAEAPSTTTLKEGGKGRPTPSRREAEAAAKARARNPRDKKEAARLQRERRTQHSARAREAMRTGDDRYLPARDKGPVRRFVRDWVDARLCMAELLLPLLILIMVTQPINQRLSSGLWTATILLVALDTAYVVFRLRRELGRRFPDRSTKGAVGYGVLRAMQLRWIRMPKSKVKIGSKLPEKY